MLPHEIAADVQAVREALQGGQKALERYIRESVQADHEYRLAKARAFLRAEGTVQSREAYVTTVTEEESLRAKLSAGQREAALEHLRNLRGELQACIANTYLCRSEMSLAGYE